MSYWQGGLLRFAGSVILELMKIPKSGHELLLCLSLATALFSSGSPAYCAGKPTYSGKMQLGQLLYFNGNIDQAIKAFKYAAQLDPNAFDPHLNLVNIYVQKQDFPAAIEECREGLKIKPKHRDLHLILGNLLRTASSSKDSDEQKKYLDEAVKELNEALELGANKALVHSTLAVVHVQTGDMKKAREHVDQAIELKDKNPDAHLIRGVLMFKDGQKAESLKELDIAIEQKEKNAEAHNTKADILFSDGKVEEAVAEYKKALKDDPKYTQAMVGLANILIKKEKWEEALEQLMKAQDLKSDDANIIYSVAICLEKMGKTEQAIPKFNEGVLVDTNPQSKAQIIAHIRDLQQKQFLNVPSLLNPSSGTPIGPGSAAPGYGLFGAGSSFFSEPMKDLIKIKAPGEKEEKESKKKSN